MALESTNRLPALTSISFGSHFESDFDNRLIITSIEMISFGNNFIKISVSANSVDKNKNLK